MVEIYCALEEFNGVTFFCYKNNRGDISFGAYNQTLNLAFPRSLFAFLHSRTPENIKVFFDDMGKYEFATLNEYHREYGFFMKNTQDYFWHKIDRDFIHTQIMPEMASSEELTLVRNYTSRLREKRFKA